MPIKQLKLQNALAIMEDKMSMGAKIDILEQYKVKDLLWASITKTNLTQEAGLHLHYDDEGVIRVQKIDGAFEMFTDVKPGDRLLELNEQDVSSFEGGLEEIKQVIKESLRVQVRVLRFSAEVLEEDDDIDDDDEEKMEINIGDTLVVYGSGNKDLENKIVEIKRASTKPGRWLAKVQDTGKMTIVDEKHLFPPESMRKD